MHKIGQFKLISNYCAYRKQMQSDEQWQDSVGPFAARTQQATHKQQRSGYAFTEMSSHAMPALEQTPPPAFSDEVLAKGWLWL